MKIDNWFNNGCNYNAGVALYSTLKQHRPNLLRLFLRKETALNNEKLQYELGKHRTEEVITPSTLPQLEIKTPTITISHPEKTNNQFYKINQLHPDLHELAIKQRDNYQNAIAIHYKLTRLHANQEAKALEYCIKIEDLFDAIETTQKILKHYVEHKVIIKPTTKDYNNFTPAQLIRAIGNKRTSVSKYSKRVELLNSKFSNTPEKAAKTQLHIKLQKAENKLLEHEADLNTLNELINEYE